MAVRYCESINFAETCTISGVDALVVGMCQQNGHSLVLVSQDLISMAFQFIEYKFGKVPHDGGAFIWNKNEDVTAHGIRLEDEDIHYERDCFLRLMRLYENKLCS